MRYAYAITGALLLAGTTASLALNPPAAGAGQTAQNAPEAMAQIAPRAGAPVSFADLVARLQPAVVNISTKQSIKVQQQANPFQGTPFQDFFNQQFGGGGQGDGQPVTRQAQSLGSGFIISADGYVVTNNHVVAPGARGATVDSITVTLVDGKEYPAKLIGRDQESDLALLKIQGANFPFVRFGDSTKARVGDWIVAIGNPFGIGSTVTAGIISALHRTTGLGLYDRFIQTDASINQGNSGGPMFDLRGEVIGINSQILSPSGGNIGIGFAIPAEQARPIVDTLMKGQAIKRGYLGVGPQPIDEDLASALGVAKNRGEIIRSVEPDTPAGRAGVRVGDVVLKVNGQDVTSEQSLTYLVGQTKPGDPIRLDILRDGRPTALTVTAGTRPSQQELAAQAGQGDDDNAMPDAGTGQNDQAMSNSVGLTVTDLTPQIQRALGLDSTAKGVVITSVDPSSDAATKGLKRGDLIVSVNRQPTNSVAALAQAVAQAKAQGREALLLFVQRGRTTGGFIAIRLKK